MRDPKTKRRRKKSWAESVGPYGHRIRVFEDPNSGILYGEMRDVSRPGSYRSVSLRHRDRDEALKWAHAQVTAWMSGEQQAKDLTPTLARVLGLYLQHQTIAKGDVEQLADRRRAELWTRFLGPTKDLSKLSLREWQSFIEQRRTGVIDSRGEPVAAEQRKRIRDGTVASDLVFLHTVLNWAAKWRTEDEHYLMSENPARGYPMPSERNPRRPVVTEDRYRKVLAAAAKVKMVVGFGRKRREEPTYLPDVLALANGTGRRISAILQLRYEDLKLTEGGPHGSILWPAATDKMKKAWHVPVSEEVRTVLNRILRTRPGIGAAFLFPAPNNPKEPLGLVVASEWLLKAEALACVEKQVGSLWHAYRRKWATERKYLPTADVAAAGGWSDQTTLMQVYQQADQATMYRVVSEPARLTSQPSTA